MTVTRARASGPLHLRATAAAAALVLCAGGCAVAPLHPVTTDTAVPGMFRKRGRAMSSVTLEEAQAHLPALIERLQPGEALVITRNDRPVARLLAEEPPKRTPRRAGSAKGQLTIVAEDEEHLKDFEEYLG